MGHAKILKCQNSEKLKLSNQKLNRWYSEVSGRRPEAGGRRSGTGNFSAAKELKDRKGLMDDECFSKAKHWIVHLTAGIGPNRTKRPMTFSAECL
jgi:hypothetical protein